MKTRDEIIKLLTKEKPELERRFRVRQMALFGSYSRGDQRANSDVDILVDVKKMGSKKWGQVYG